MSGRMRKSRHKAVIVIETDHDNPLASSSGRKAFYSAFTTFNLAVMGSSVLPMPYAMSHTGAAIGLATMLLVALCNDFTSMLMVNNAYETGLDSYESLALWAGGPKWKVFTQVTLIALLWGPNSGGLSLMGDVAQVMCDRAFGNPPTLGHFFGLPTSNSSSSNSTITAAGATSAFSAAYSPVGSFDSFAGAAAAAAVSPYASWVPDSLLHSTNLGWLLNGQALMVIMTIIAVYPLSCQKHMRSLESAAGVGLLIVAALCGLLGYKAWSQGFPAVTSGEFPLWSLRVTADLPEAFSLLGFAFYLQPLMMPIIREMPEGRTGRNALSAAVHASVLGSCLVLYACAGFFGAALFGHSTCGNVMVNDILGDSLGRLGFGVVYGAMMLYLAAGAAASQYPLRAAIDMALMGARVPMTRPRAMCIQGVTLSVSLCIALLNPGGAEKIYALVGASGVCIVCYVLPVWFHLRLMHVRRQAAKSQVTTAAASPQPDVEQLAVPLLYASPHSSASSLAALAAAAAATAAGYGQAGSGSSRLSLASRCRLAWVWLRSAMQVLLPLFVMVVGIGFSAAAMYVAVNNIIKGS
uniref:Amino acid transporter transmembrane domain-containing protein n=1 Tax=Tetradesmus obliquus TaxID=3088 RepID=A0A383V717_TETOB|eukprot:jgi/Sobl393_1/13658/SZX60374.1